MTKIDPSRLSAIFRTLSSKESHENQSLKNRTEEKKTQGTKSILIESSIKKDKNTLKQKIADKLKKLRNETIDFNEKAPLVTVKEILLWEFGEELITHPDFNYLSQTIVDEVNSNKSLQNYMKKLIDIYSN